MNAAAAQTQVAVPPVSYAKGAADTPKTVEPPLSMEAVAGLPSAEQKAYVKGTMDGYMRGREMKLVVEQQRMAAIHTLEKILAVVDDPEQVRTLASDKISECAREMRDVLDA